MTQARSRRNNRLHPGKRCIFYVALHPLRGATPVTRRCTRSEEVQCPRIGCTYTPNKYLHGHTITSHTVRWAHCHCRQPTQQPALSRHALHPLRRTTPDQKRCNAHGSGAPPLDTSITAGSSGRTCTQPSKRQSLFLSRATCVTQARSRHSNRLHPSKRCTRYVALHPLRRTTPDQKRCNVHGSGAAPLPTNTFTATQSR